MLAVQQANLRAEHGQREERKSDSGHELVFSKFPLAEIMRDAECHHNQRDGRRRTRSRSGVVGTRANAKDDSAYCGNKADGDEREVRSVALKGKVLAMSCVDRIELGLDLEKG